MTSRLFTPLEIGPVTMANRIMIAPMCQYSAIEGSASSWHTVHLGSLALSGSGLLCLEATGVSAEGRITHGCLGLYSDQNEAALAQVLAHLRAVSPIRLAIQLSHAGRKSSSRAPWEGGTLISPEDGGWLPLAPSAVAQRDGEAPPRAMTAQDITKLVDDFARSAARARRLGFDAVELHMAHGYLLHQFLSPLANQREDEYGGSLENRMRLPLRVFDAVQQACGPDMAVGIRLSAKDWVEGGWDVEQSIVLCRELDRRGCHFFDISSGGVSPAQQIPVGPGYQVHLAEAIKREVKAPVIAVGLITEAAQAEAIVADGRADAIAMARGMLLDPRWPWRAALELGGTVTAPKQYWRSLPAGTSKVFGDIRSAQR
ncbi:NADH:flavin oxidoreductase/NADH oxidase [Lacisediminimonas profundi]|uniref:NADH:flavin oxidoreductase/NADH oxidase n=1 Tax=Lacisediminimonas profundi TaxID=2603856 RepID=UPI00124AEF16|nr:NADH:flavin oxidoreductase/NADH oxidase [Lacisediminimonas profundi]